MLCYPTSNYCSSQKYSFLRTKYPGRMLTNCLYTCCFGSFSFSAITRKFTAFNHRFYPKTGRISSSHYRWFFTLQSYHGWRASELGTHDGWIIFCTTQAKEWCQVWSYLDRCFQRGRSSVSQRFSIALRYPSSPFYLSSLFCLFSSTFAPFLYQFGIVTGVLGRRSS